MLIRKGLHDRADRSLSTRSPRHCTGTISIVDPAKDAGAALSRSTQCTNRRIECLDAFRGLAVAAMLLVNNPGSVNDIYWPLRHSEWNGYTPADLIFPSFLFIAGGSMCFSMARRVIDDQRPAMAYICVIRRVILLFVLGLVVNSFLDIGIHGFRAMGVLQRIALCSLVAYASVLVLPKLGLWICCVTILSMYWMVMLFLPVPGFGSGDLSIEGNLATYIDLSVLGTSDPEGLLTTMPAVVSVLIGYLACDWIRLRPVDSMTTFYIFSAGIGGVAVGYAWGIFFAINKHLWTSSYTTVSAGWSIIILSILYETMEVRRLCTWSTPFTILGKNAILVFVGSSLADSIMAHSGAQAYIIHVLSTRWTSITDASLLYASANLFVWLFICVLLHKQCVMIRC